MGWAGFVRSGVVTPRGGRSCGKIVSVLVREPFGVDLLGEPSSPGGWPHLREDRVCAGQGAVRGRSSWSAFVTRGVAAFAGRSCLCWSGSRSGSIFLVSLRHPGGGRIRVEIGQVRATDPLVDPLPRSPSSPH